VGKIAEKAVCKSVFFTILSAELKKNALFQIVFFLAILPTGHATIDH